MRLALIFLLLSTGALGETRFRTRMVADPTTFDWNRATTQMETVILMNVMEGLFAFDADMKLQPALALSYTTSADRLAYTFKLREGVKWSDGVPLTAQDFVYSWQRLLDPLTAAPYAYFLFSVENAEDFNRGKIKDFSKVGIKATGTHTLRVTLKSPVPFFPQMFTFWVTFPVRKDLVEKYGNDWANPGKVAVLGPFVPASYTPQSQIVLKRNEKYWGRRPEIDTVVMHIINEDTTALNQFKAGKLDFTMPVSFLEAGNLVKTPAFHSAPHWRTSYLAFNVNQYPLNLMKVRKAIALSIDRSKMGRVMHQRKPQADSLLAPELFPEGRGAALPFDPAQGKKLLEEVGITPRTAPKLELLAFSSDENALLAQYIQDQIKRNLGLEVKIRMPEFKAFRTQIDLRTSALYYFGWGADYADPDTFFGVFLSDSGNNKMRWRNARYDELVRKAAQMPDGPERRKLYVEALDILLRQDVAIAPLHYNTFTYLLSPRFRKFVINPLNYVYFRDIVLSR